QLIDRENRQRLLELFFDPERWMWTNTTAAHMEALSAANSVGGAAESSFKSAFQSINEPLVNVANEESALGSFGAKKGARTQGQAIFLIQQMYKQVFMPMAVLLLLPGTLLTQCKGLVGFGFLGSKEDASSPFEGFLRALIAVFLIPTTQLIVSYSI